MNQLAAINAFCSKIPSLGDVLIQLSMLANLVQEAEMAMKDAKAAGNQKEMGHYGDAGDDICCDIFHCLKRNQTKGC